MASNTKIFVFKRKVLIYTGFFTFLGLFLIISLLLSSKKDDSTSDKIASYGEVNAFPSKAASNTSYKDGTYSSSIILNNKNIILEIIVSNNTITSVSIKEMDPELKISYPLLENAVADISSQLLAGTPLSEISYSSDCKYTYLIILDAIKGAIKAP